MPDKRDSTWLWQGIISNTVSNFLWLLLAVAGAFFVGYLKAQGSLLAAPILYGLSTFFLILGCGVLIRWSRRISVKPFTAKDARVSIRDWLDKAGLEVRNTPTPNCMFSYVVTLNAKRIAVGQLESEPSYLHFHSSLTFNDADNTLLAQVPGGIYEIIRALRIGLALLEIGYSGLDTPLREVVVTKRIFMPDDFNEDKFLAALFKVESAFNLLSAIVARLPAAQPAPLQSTPVE
jgi:hypothetical protein